MQSHPFQPDFYPDEIHILIIGKFLKQNVSYSFKDLEYTLCLFGIGK